MTIKEAIWGDNNASPNNNFEWGPSTLTGVYKLLRVQMSISFGFEAAAGALGDYLLAEQAWGVQYVNSGDSPLAIPGDLSAYQFLIADLTIGDTTGLSTWAPSTDSPGIFTFGTLRREWYGQRVIEGDIDLWVSYNVLVTGAGNAVASWLMRVDYV